MTRWVCSILVLCLLGPAAEAAGKTSGELQIGSYVDCTSGTFSGERWALSGADAGTILPGTTKQRWVRYS